MIRNECTVAGLIQDLQQFIKQGRLNPDSRIWIGESQRYSNHRYLIGSWMVTPVPVEPEHSCDSAQCTCTPSDGLPSGNCPVCDCYGCNTDDDYVEQDLYLMLGDQDPYQLPNDLEDL